MVPMDQPGASDQLRKSQTRSSHSRQSARASQPLPPKCLDLDAIPSPTEVTEDDRNNWGSEPSVTGVRGQVPPPVTANLLVNDQGNTSPPYIRCTAYTTPCPSDVGKAQRPRQLSSGLWQGCPQRWLRCVSLTTGNLALCAAITANHVRAPSCSSSREGKASSAAFAAVISDIPHPTPSVFNIRFMWMLMMVQKSPWALTNSWPL